MFKYMIYMHIFFGWFPNSIGRHRLVFLPSTSQEDSEAMYRSVLEVRERTLGPQHANTLRAKANLAETGAQRMETLETPGFFSNYQLGLQN